MLRSSSIDGTLTAKTIRRTDGRLDATGLDGDQGEVFEGPRPGRESHRDARLLVRADAGAAPERQARRRRRRHGQEAARAPDDAARAERRQARDAGPPGARSRPRGSRAPGARAEGGRPATAPGSRRPGEAAAVATGEARRLAAAAADEDRGVPLAEGSDQGAVLGRGSAGANRRGCNRDRTRHAGHRPRHRAREGEDGADAGARLGDRRAHRGRLARRLHVRRLAARPRARNDLRVFTGRQRSRAAEARGGHRRRSRAAEGDRAGLECGPGAELDRRVEDAEPAREILLDGQLAGELRLQLELFGVVALLAVAERDERPERGALVAVQPIHGVLPAVETEDGGEQLLPEAARLQLRAVRMHPGDLILEIGVGGDDPRVAERVVAPLELRARVDGDRFEQLLDVVLRLRELTGRERLEDDGSRTRTLQPELGLECDGSGREREQPLDGRRLQLLASEEDVAETQRLTRRDPFRG